MRIIVFISILFCSFMFSQKTSPYTIIKKELLYKDKKGNIYLKNKVSILSKQKEDDKTVYLDNVLYKNSMYKLNKFIDVTTFHLTGTSDKKDAFVRGVYEDRKYRYIFRNHPTASPNIIVLDK